MLCDSGTLRKLKNIISNFERRTFVEPKRCRSAIRGLITKTLTQTKFMAEEDNVTRVGNDDLEGR